MVETLIHFRFKIHVMTYCICITWQCMIIQTSVIIPDTNCLEPAKMLGNKREAVLSLSSICFRCYDFQDIPVAMGLFGYFLLLQQQLSSLTKWEWHVVVMPMATRSFSILTCWVHPQRTVVQTFLVFLVGIPIPPPKKTYMSPPFSR